MHVSYNPIQTISKKLPVGVKYTEFEPSKDLKPWIYCYWLLENNTALTQPFEYRVITDGCIDLFWDTLRPEPPVIMGVTNEFNVFSLGIDFKFLGIRLAPGAFTSILRIPASEFSSQIIDIDLFNRSLS